MEYNIEEYKLNYRAMIPFYILLDDDLSKSDLKLYGLIEQMESSQSHVFYTNRAIGEILGIAVRNVQLAKRRLQEKNYLNCEYKEILIKGKKVWMHCWNTVKGGLVQQQNEPPPPDDVPDHPTDDPQHHPAPDPENHPCNALDLKALNEEEKQSKDVVIFDSKTDKTIVKRLENVPQGEKSVVQLLKEIHFNVKKNFDKNPWKGIYGSLSLIKNGTWTTPSGYVDLQAIEAEKAKIKAQIEAREQAQSIAAENKRKADYRAFCKSKGLTPPDWCMA